MSDNLFLFTDGGCHGNPGPGAWAWRLVDRNDAILGEDSGYAADTTNNRMELTAVIEGLTSFRRGSAEHRTTALIVVPTFNRVSPIGSIGGVETDGSPPQKNR